MEPNKGVFFFARDGKVVGSVRLIEVAPQVVVVQDMVVDGARRGEGIGGQLLRAAMNSRGGTLYLRCYSELVPYYERLGFAIAGEDDLPEPVAGHFRAAGELPQATEYMSAR